MGIARGVPLGFLRNDRVRLPAALAAGAVLWAFSLPPYGIGVLGIAAWVPVLWALPGERAGRAAAWGWAGGIAWEFSTLWWLIPTLVRYGSISEPVAVALVLGMCAVLGLYMAGFLGTMAWLLRRRGPWALALAPCAWVLWEWLRGHLFSGMPWWGPGYSLSLYPAFLQATRLTGILGLSFLALAIAAALTLWLRFHQHRVTQVFVPAVLVLVGGVFLWGIWWQGRPVGWKAEVPVGYLQPDIGQNVKWDPAHAAETLDTTLVLSRAFRSYGLKLLVWPESSTPFEWDQDEAFRRKVQAVSGEIAAPILVGSVLTAGAGYKNGAVLALPDGREGARYAKTHLVPFGEYIPFRTLLSFAPIVNAIGDFQPGSSSAPIATPAGRAGVTICFEGIFPDLVRAQVRQGAQLLVNMTNDAWYEGTPGPTQHFLLERVRAVETDRFLVRSANRGTSGVVNPRGQLVATTTAGRPASFWGLVSPRDTTTLWTLLGNLWLLLPLAALAVAAWPARMALPGSP